MTLHLQTFAQIFADHMLNGMIEGLVLGALGAALLWSLKRQSSSTRFAILFSTLFVIAALPFLGNGSSSGVLSHAHSTFHLPAYWATDIFIAWAVLASAGLGKIVLSYWRLRRLRNTCTAVDTATLDPMPRATLKEFATSRKIAILTSDRVRVPAAIGFAKPAIILPAWSLQDLSANELNAILLHELAHLRRWDDWTNLAQEILKALLFFHPAVWWIGRGLSLEREMACDDFVLAGSSSPRAYAECLVSVAEKSYLKRGVALAQAVAGRMRQTTQRVARILSGNRPAATKVYKPALVATVAFSIISFAAVPHVPKLVAFGENNSGVTEADGAEISSATSNLSNAGAHVIPASLHIGNSNHEFTTKNSRAVPRQRRRSQSLNRHAIAPHAAAAKAALVQTDEARLIKASANTTGSAQADVPRPMLLLIQTEQVDNYGRVWSMSISIMQFTIYHPATHQVANAIVPKTT